MSGGSVRWATIDDFAEIAELDREVWKANRNSEFIPDGEHVWRIWIDHAYVCVAIDGSKVVGVALSFPSIKPNIHFLHKIFLAKGFAGQGMGTKLLGLICSAYDDNEITAQLTTDTNNQAMQALASKMQFNNKELVQGYYRESEDRWVYTRVPKPHAR